ncbi:hypothetical protein [Endozoicomonas sp. SCSIO W0465]|uniref:hypothetical protein n=1 Tax=Endozoicomonas sp. SCSIO W0465 TaxID=2918516 RepID=UPI002075DA36|nr:hypothetical protein [Endozoicomonas sp. SCSIO W0465]USE35234.1 hypothetical protein MJO57_24510 [Endozoicomonas sp. SCSIO W0465]
MVIRKILGYSIGSKLDDISKEIQIIDQQLHKLEEDRQVLLARRQRLIANLDSSRPKTQPIENCRFYPEKLSGALLLSGD